jgi:hypothetical protein
MRETAHYSMLQRGENLKKPEISTSCYCLKGFGCEWDMIGFFLRRSQKPL